MVLSAVVNETAEACVWDPSCVCPPLRALAAILSIRERYLVRTLSAYPPCAQQLNSSQYPHNVGAVNKHQQPTRLITTRSSVLLRLPPFRFLRFISISLAFVISIFFVPITPSRFSFFLVFLELLIFQPLSCWNTDLVVCMSYSMLILAM